LGCRAGCVLLRGPSEYGIYGGRTPGAPALRLPKIALARISNPGALDHVLGVSARSLCWGEANDAELGLVSGSSDGFDRDEVAGSGVELAIGQSAEG